MSDQWHPPRRRRKWRTNSAIYRGCQADVPQSSRGPLPHEYGQPPRSGDPAHRCVGHLRTGHPQSESARLCRHDRTRAARRADHGQLVQRIPSRLTTRAPRLRPSGSPILDLQVAGRGSHASSPATRSRHALGVHEPGNTPTRHPATSTNSPPGWRAYELAYRMQMPKSPSVMDLSRARPDHDAAKMYGMNETPRPPEFGQAVA